MPEGPEVKRFADDLSKLLVGKKIINMFPCKTGRYAVNPPVGFDAFIADMPAMGSCIVNDVQTKGKFMWWTLTFTDPGHMFKTKKWYLWITHGMYAQWTHEKTTHAAFSIFYDASRSTDSLDCMYFNDKRHYGTLKFSSDVNELEKKLDSLGPDMLSYPPSFAEFSACLMLRSKKTIAEALMDQSVISGVGNYVKAESLYVAGISPHRIVGSLSVEEVELLRLAIIDVMKASYESGGWPINAYKGDGKPAEGWQSRFAVYGNKHDPLGNEVITETTKDKRVTHWCPTVQT